MFCDELKRIIVPNQSRIKAISKETISKLLAKRYPGMAGLGASMNEMHADEKILITLH